MEVRKMKNNNLCECYEEELGYSVWVQSDETGLWFNMKDIIKTFCLSNNKLNKINNRMNDKDKILIDFYRDNQKVREYFISESMVHEVMSINRKETVQAEKFIYMIIKDYDENVNINDGTDYYSTEERMALHILQIDYNKFLDDHHEQLEILKDKPVYDEMEEFKHYFDYWFEDCEMQYDNESLPNDKKNKLAIKRRNEQLNKSNKLYENNSAFREVDKLVQLSHDYENELNHDRHIKLFGYDYDENEFKYNGELGFEEITYEDSLDIIMSYLKDNK